VFQLTLKQGSNQLQYPDVRLINQHQQSTWLCTPHDFNLLADGPRRYHPRTAVRAVDHQA